MEPTQDALDSHLEAALEAADDDTTRYHLRQALQLRIAEKETDSDRISV
ncbi:MULTISPECIES: hypothetical protein [Haloarcula]|nr:MULTISPECIES: hypothetical protein [Halomicroarcula]MBX0347296.1 hypothetical protein [Halomicroarcula pellucida]MDS0276829.1 hypothetical protein [Halomicroarcula sp. S1AR25-4]QIO22748.1 hypothetical protein G9465_10475 [Haloarcula sp. JP-L23]